MYSISSSYYSLSVSIIFYFIMNYILPVLTVRWSNRGFLTYNWRERCSLHLSVCNPQEHEPKHRCDNLSLTSIRPGGGGVRWSERGRGRERKGWDGVRGEGGGVWHMYSCIWKSEHVAGCLIWTVNKFFLIQDHDLLIKNFWRFWEVSLHISRILPWRDRSSLDSSSCVCSSVCSDIRLWFEGNMSEPRSWTSPSNALPSPWQIQWGREKMPLQSWNK